MTKKTPILIVNTAQDMAALNVKIISGRLSLKGMSNEF
jgi:hypothetical protein